MKSFDKIFAAVTAIIAAIFMGANLYLLCEDNSESVRMYLVEINRIALKIENSGIESINPGEYDYVTNIEKYSGSSDFYAADSDYCIRKIGDELYRFDYLQGGVNDKHRLIAAVNLLLAAMALVTIAVLIFVRQKILLPFSQIADVPHQLAKGNLTAPVKESKSRFFGKFMWGIDLLRKNIEQQKQLQLDLQKEKKTLLLSLSHDIKTPLSAIKLYAKALCKGLYPDKQKQLEIAENINAKADEIEGFVSQIIGASREDFLSFDVHMSEFYLSQLMDSITDYYREKLALVKIKFTVDKYSDCLLKGDADRSVEVLQNVIENAVKYGDGQSIHIAVSEEEDCRLIAVSNSGCTLSEFELPHIFESFWRGSNTGNHNGSGLGLYVCRQLMHKMNGEIFAEIKDGFMTVTAVFSKV